jgi:hypothetical protein
MPDNSDELSQYECERLQNIKRNHEVLQSLGLDDQLRVAKAPRRRSSEPDPSAPTRTQPPRLKKWTGGGAASADGGTSAPVPLGDGGDDTDDVSDEEDDDDLSDGEEVDSEVEAEVQAEVVATGLAPAASVVPLLAGPADGSEGEGTPRSEGEGVSLMASSSRRSAQVTDFHAVLQAGLAPAKRAAY